jgi:hypothetical protein
LIQGAIRRSPARTVGLPVHLPGENIPEIMSISHLRQGIVSAVVLIAAFIGYGILRYPLLISQAGASSVLFPLGMLLLYGIAAVGRTYQPRLLLGNAFQSGTTFGLLVGGLFIVDISAENFVDLKAPPSTILTLGFMFIIFILFVLAGWRGARDSGEVRLGLFAAIWSAVIGVLIALIFGLVINFIFLHRLEQNLLTSAEYARSTIHDLGTFTFWNTLDSASSHLFEAPIIAAVMGALGSLISLGQNRLRKNSSHIPE